MPKNSTSRQRQAAQAYATPLEIILDYNFIETLPLKLGLGLYAETFLFEDECGGSARHFHIAPGQKELTWRCSRPFVLFFQDVVRWNKYFAPKSHAGDPYLYHKGTRRGEWILAAVESVPHCDPHHYPNYLLQLTIKDCAPPSAGRFYYAIVPNLQVKPDTRVDTMAAGPPNHGRGGINF